MLFIRITQIAELDINNGHRDYLIDLLENSTLEHEASKIAEENLDILLSLDEDKLDAILGTKYYIENYELYPCDEIERYRFAFSLAGSTGKLARRCFENLMSYDLKPLDKEGLMALSHLLQGGNDE